MEWYRHIYGAISNSWFIKALTALKSKHIREFTILPPTSPKILAPEWTIEEEEGIEGGYAEDLAGFIYAPYIPIYISKGEQMYLEYPIRIIRR